MKGKKTKRRVTRERESASERMEDGIINDKNEVSFCYVSRLFEKGFLVLRNNGVTRLYDDGNKRHNDTGRHRVVIHVFFSAPFCALVCRCTSTRLDAEGCDVRVAGVRV